MTGKAKGSVDCPACGRAVVPRRRCLQGWADELLDKCLAAGEKLPGAVVFWYACPECEKELPGPKQEDRP